MRLNFIYCVIYVPAPSIERGGLSSDLRGEELGCK
jgi:hypothetical protein